MASHQPMLPPLYFENHSAAITRDSSGPEIPSEILSHVLTWSNWGDLAKLASVQRSWSTILQDSAKHSIAAQWELAQALLEGRDGLATNPLRAFRLMKELSQVVVDQEGKPTRIRENASCFAPTMRKIADCYFDGTGVEPKPEMGLAWLEASFTLGETIESAHETALLYEYGRNGIEVDVVAAAQWFEKAARAGHVEAMAELGLCYELGCGVEQSDEEALDWYTKAANLGHVTAKFSVGEIFEEARGVPQSDQEACLWYYRAALVGDEDSKTALRRLYDIARIVVPGVSEILDE